MTRIGCLILSGVLLLSPRVLHAAALDQELKSLSEKFQAPLTQLLAGGANGQLKEADAKLVEFAEKNPSPGMYLLIGNILYRRNFDASYTLHKKAWEGSQDDPLAIVEWAKERHRKGEIAAAIPLYQKYLELVPTDVAKKALLADCLVRSGKLRDAVKVWAAADFARHEKQVGVAIFSIYGGYGPEKRRDELLKQIQGGNQKLMEDLIYRDIHFNPDWWTKRINHEGLKGDLELVGKTLGLDSHRYKNLTVYANVAGQDKIKDKAVKQALSDGGLIIGDKGRLPASSVVAHQLINITLQHKLEIKAQLLARFEKILMERAKTKDDVEALKVICELCHAQDNGTKLVNVCNYGWEHFKEPIFAFDYLDNMTFQGKLKPDSAKIQKAVEQFPNNGPIRFLQLRLMDAEKITADVVVAAIKANYSEPVIGAGEPEFSDLDSLFDLLDKKVNSSPPKQGSTI